VIVTVDVAVVPAESWTVNVTVYVPIATYLWGGGF
jgi:hypothetical protein